MKITFIGLSCFMLENKQGDRLLLEPYYGDSQFGLGIRFPEDLQADVFLVSHPDEDHSFLRHSMLRQRRNSHDQDVHQDVDVFPDFNLRGTFVREWNGDPCIAFSFTIDGMRCIHLADNAHVLSKRQVDEIGEIDVLFVPMPKGDLRVAVDIIKQLKPKLAIPAHYIPVAVGTESPSHEQIATEIHELLTAECFTAGWLKDADSNNHTQKVFVTLFENALKVQESFEDAEEIAETSFEVSVDSLPSQTALRVFRDCIGKQVT